MQRLTGMHAAHDSVEWNMEFSSLDAHTCSVLKEMRCAV